ncbi:hypothetical protein [Deinococcus roseus]|uniref:Nucleotidyltransferase n=1 Tax=Deinococcus roseus TaxID=392414 RepID=A0ABQ2DJ12_9DEIO|nr:hypothetical protein [Deinococcus roseus]GGJ57237.1 hypothetical protein GCM10008938_49200 [Deinococcus roseus]
MGGKALKNHPTRRYHTDEYLKLYQEMEPVLQEIVQGRVELLPFYTTKETHGDMDIVVESDHLPPNWTEKVMERFASRDCYNNGDTFTFEFRDLQIDLIKATAEEFEHTLNFLSFNDLGGLLGKLANHLGFKLGHQGLQYRVKDGTNTVRVLKLTSDYLQSLEFLGYDPERFRQGFDTLREVYEYVCSSPYFYPGCCLIENQNSKNRQRDRKRPTYQGFLEFMEEEGYLERIPHPVSTREEQLQRAIDTFPGFEEALQDTYRFLELKRAAHQKFNGHMVREWSGVEGQHLGEVMMELRHTFPGVDATDFEQWVLDTDLQAIRQEVEGVVERLKPGWTAS